MQTRAPHGIQTAFRRWSVSLKHRLITRTPGDRRPTGDGWAAALEQIIADLEGLNGCTERDFLTVGEKLMESRSTARRIASDMTALTELVSGEHSRNASHALTRMLEHSREMDARTERSGQALGDLRALSSRIRLAFAGLRNTVSVFRTLCTLTRIETSRLGSTGAGFGDLAAEVGPLSEIIQSSGEGVLEASTRLDQSIQSTIRSSSDLRARQRRELPALIDGVMDGLKAFEERQQRAVESSARQAAGYESVCDAIDGVVESVQFHDITRQQIEHVVQALRQVRSESESGRGKLDCMSPDARAILALQSSQLAGAAGIFASSIERMEHDLEGISLRMRDMSEAGRTLIGISADDHDSYFLRRESQFAAILEMLASCTAAQAEMQSTAANLDATIGGMRDSVAGIRGIEIRIQRIAINATIRAAHIGSAGNALNAIAGVMERLNIDSGKNTEDAAGTLDAMSEASRRVCGSVESGTSHTRANINEIVGEMQRTIVELHSSSESSFSRANQIAALSGRLAKHIGAVRNGFSAGLLFARVVNHARAELDGIAAQGGQNCLEGIAQTQQLAGLARHYTMQIERDVHESLLGEPAVGAPAEEALGAVLADGDLGENVELF